MHKSARYVRNCYVLKVHRVKKVQEGLDQMELSEVLQQLSIEYHSPIVRGMLNGLSELDEESQATVFGKTGVADCRGLLEAKLESGEEVPTDIVKSLLKGISELDEESLATVLGKMGRSCCQGIMQPGIQKGTIPTGLDMESACEYALAASFGDYQEEKTRKTWFRESDDFYVDDYVKEKYGQCMCVLVILGLRAPEYEFCKWCSSGFVQETFEYLVGKPMQVECLETAITGSPYCRCKINLK